MISDVDKRNVFTYKGNLVDPVNSLEDFAEYCFGLDNTWFHREWYRLIEDEAIRRGLLIAPRGSAKSTCWSKIAPLWLLGNNPDLRIVLLSRTSSLSQRNLAFIRQNVESNDKVKKVFPSKKLYNRVFGLNPSSPWGVEQITVENNRHDGDCSIYAVGLGGTITGIRADVIIVDDLIDMNNVMTEGQRAKVIEYWRNVVIPTLNPGGRIFSVGTRWFYDDFYSMLIDDPDFNEHMFSFPALKENENGGLTSYWPEYHSVEKLLQQKEDMGTLAWNCQMMCDPSGYKGALFNPDDLIYYNPERHLLPIWGDLDFVMSIDPNIMDDPKSDDTCIVTGAVDRKRGDVYVLDVYAEPLEYVTQVKAMKQYGGRNQVQVGGHLIGGEVKISKIGVDATAYQRSLQQTGYLMGLPIVECKTGNMDKNQRILGLQPHFENGRIRLPDPDKVSLPWWGKFYEQYTSFPQSRRDDVLDALEILVSMVTDTFGMSGIPWGPTSDSRRRVIWEPDRGHGGNVSPGLRGKFG